MDAGDPAGTPRNPHPRPLSRAERGRGEPDSSFSREAGEGQDEGGTPLRVLLYRYFFFDWLFRDASRGTMMDRASALHFNRQMSHHLLTYLRRWVGVVVGSCALGAGFEKALLLTWTATVFYCLSSAALVTATMIARMWVGLRFE